MIDVSVLIPVYNGEEFIAQAVDSVLSQEDVEFEVIVIDDGSNDSTGAILAGYGDRVRVIRQRNGGHVKARNNGAKLAGGEWIAFLDADDCWRPSKLRKQLSAADLKTELVYTDRENFGDLSRVSKIQSDAVRHHEGDIFEPLLYNNFITVASVIMRKACFERLGGFDESLHVCEDWDLWLRFAARGGMAKCVPEPLTLYRWHAQSMSNDQDKMCLGRRIVVERAIQSERGKALGDAAAARARATAWRCSAWHAMPFSRSRAIHWYSKAAMVCPRDLSIYKQIAKCLIGRS
ncbi:glycosyltransferase [Allorhodopirellula solitaria]|uniref:Putative glycosyltransferase EpsJ n=1 Tax=Allorhodopirellula solitaria TaxID=2527987 RepID=A0A5C5WZ21_9BACT|nr:glycosyltransferase [Allorhodopirellula solitaria]TWT55858.1 putative glycosyltransferase EpsJ [Allorhodopirellula solitaria]